MTENQWAALVEDLDHKFDIIIESLSFMATKAEVQQMRDELEGRSIEHEQWLSDHEVRIGALEASA